MEIADLRLQLGRPEIDQLKVLPRIEALGQGAGVLIPDLVAAIRRGVFSSGPLFVPTISRLKSQELLNCVMNQFGKDHLNAHDKCDLLKAGFVLEIQQELVNDLYECFERDTAPRCAYVEALAAAGTSSALATLKVIEARMQDRIRKFRCQLDSAESVEERAKLVSARLVGATDEPVHLGLEEDFLQKVQHAISVVCSRSDPEPARPEPGAPQHPGLENANQEFKSSLRWDLRQNKTNLALVQAVVKTIAAFGNTVGGTLWIGVDDKGKSMGLEGDYRGWAGDKDKFERVLRTDISNSIEAAFCAKCVQVDFPLRQDIEVCRVVVHRWSFPLFVKDGPNQVFYVRDGNRSVPLQGDALMRFCEKRFPKST